MSEKIGPVALDALEEGVFLGKELVSRRAYSDKTAEEIDHEVERMVKAAEEYAYDLLAKNRKALEAIAHALVERETLDSDDLQAILEGAGLEGIGP